MPKGFFPQQDTGTLAGNLRADQSISFQAMEQKLRSVHGHRAGRSGGAGRGRLHRRRRRRSAAGRHQHRQHLHRPEAAGAAQGSERSQSSRACASSCARSPARGCSCRPSRTSAPAAARAIRSTSTRSSADDLSGAVTWTPKITEALQERAGARPTSIPISRTTAWTSR